MHRRQQVARYDFVANVRDRHNGLLHELSTSSGRSTLCNAGECATNLRSAACGLAKVQVNVAPSSNGKSIGILSSSSSASVRAFFHARSSLFTLHALRISSGKASNTARAPLFDTFFNLTNLFADYSIAMANGIAAL